MDDMGDGPPMTGLMWHPELPPTFARLVAQHLQPIPVFPIICVLLLAAYAAAVVHLRRRGVRWPIGRTIAFVTGVGVLWMITATGIEGYGMVLFSVHMFQHMMLTMVTPILLLLGAPVTLALRALPARGRGSGVRAGLLTVLHSRVLAVLASAPSRWFLLLSGLYGIYFTPAFDALMGNVWGHYLMLAHFLITGCLFFAPLVAADPVPGRVTPLMRILELFVSVSFHAFFGITLMSASAPVVNFFTHPPAGWNVDVLADQNRGGGIAWIFTDVPTILVAAVIFVEWFRTERRAEKRRNRRTSVHDADLDAYNEFLTRLAQTETASQTVAPDEDRR